MKSLNTYSGSTNTKWDIEINLKETNDSIKPTIIDAMFMIAKEKTNQRPITLDIQWGDGKTESQTR